MWLIYLKIHQARLTKMQPPLHSSFWQEYSHSGRLRCAYNWIVVTKPNAINFCKNPKPDTSERAFRHLPPNRPTPRLLPLLPTPPVHSAGTVGRRKKPQTNEQETLLQSLNMCHKRSTPGPKRTELKARWHELQHLGGQRRGRSSSKGEVQRSSKTPLEGVRRLAEHNVNN